MSRGSCGMAVVGETVARLAVMTVAVVSRGRSGDASARLPGGRGRSCLLHDRADVVQARDEARPVRLPRAARVVGEADDVGAALAQAGGEAEALGVVDQRDEARLAVAVVAHKDR